MKKVKIYLSNTNAITYPVVRKGLMPMLKKLEYVYNVKGNDIVLDCQHLTKDNFHFKKAELFEQIESRYKQLNK